jgi:hypothetical protein
MIYLRKCPQPQLFHSFSVDGLFQFSVFVEFIFNAFTTTSERATHRQLNNSSLAVVGVEIFLKKIKSDVF